MGYDLQVQTKSTRSPFFLVIDFVDFLFPLFKHQGYFTVQVHVSFPLVRYESPTSYLLVRNRFNCDVLRIYERHFLEKIFLIAEVGTLVNVLTSLIGRTQLSLLVNINHIKYVIFACDPRNSQQPMLLTILQQLSYQSIYYI